MVLTRGMLETSKEYETMITQIARNRKYLLHLFGQITAVEPVTFNIVKKGIGNLLRSVGIEIENDCYPLLFQFAEKDGKFDYKYMLDIYKERMSRINLPPTKIGHQKSKSAINF